MVVVRGLLRRLYNDPGVRPKAALNALTKALGEETPQTAAACVTVRPSARSRTARCRRSVRQAV